MASESERRKLTDLRVVDLRAELEKRNIDKAGVKAVLIERMQQVLKDEGLDPEEYLFETSEKRTVKRSSLSRADAESEVQSNTDEAPESEDEVKPDVVKQELMDEAEQCDGPSPHPTSIKMEDTEPIKDGDDDDDMNASDAKDLAQDDDAEKSEAEKSMPEESTPEGSMPEKSTPEKIMPEKSTAEKVTAERVAIENGLDNEDSINLTIGEDEEKLLSEEEDVTNQDKGTKVDDTTAGSNSALIVADGGQKTSSSSEQQDAATTEKASTSPSRASDNPGKKSTPQENNWADEGECTTANASNSNGKTKSSASGSGNDPKTAKDDKDKKNKSSASPTSSSSNGRNLWVSGLSSSTRATDLKQVFSKFGKVIGAKVVTNARTPGARCYGYVTMATSEDASKCIQHLHRTELHGRMISVERAKGDSTGPPRKSETKSVGGGAKVKGDEKKRHERKAATSSKPEEDKADEVPANSVGDEPDVKEELVTVDEEESAPPPPDATKPEDNDSSRGGLKPRHRSVGSSHYSRPQSRSPHRGSATRNHRPVSPRRPGVLTFTQIRDERERQRQREREREQREEDRRRRDEMMRVKQIEKRQCEEAARLDKELERLRVERANMARERADLIRLERQYQQMEREKLDRDREELKRQQLRLLATDDTRRTVKRPSDDRRDPYPDDRKRVTTDRRFEVPTPRFEEASSRSSDFHSNKKEVRRGTEFPRRDGYEEARTSRRPEGVVVRRDVPEVPRVNKEARFERPPAFRVREERRTETDHRSKLDVRPTRERYSEPTKESRYGERRGDTWHAGGGAPPAKPFASMTSRAPPGDTWVSSGDRKSDGAQGWGRTIDSGDRWVSGGSVPMASVRGGPSMGGPNSLYPPQGLPPSLSNINMPMSGSGVPYASDRFDSYKAMGPMRKY